MAFPFPSLPPLPSLASYSSGFTLSQEDFNLFHSIDRELFTRLVLNLGRDPGESMQVMALWLWFERASYCRNIVHKILPLPLTLVNALADEAVMCLNCIEHDALPTRYENIEIALTQSFTQNDISLSLRFFHGIRVAAIRGVTQIVNEVCTRAFKDIIQNLLENNQNPILGGFDENPGGTDHQELLNVNNNNTVVGGGGQEQQVGYGPIVGLPLSGNPNIGFVPFVEARAAGRGILNVPNAAVGPMDPRAIMEGVANACEISRAFDQYDLAYQRHILSHELGDLLGNMNLTGNEDEEERDLVPADDRTIFLTFSKGYPISETEVTDFITRRYGDCIDSIFMQEVLPDEQVLYARLVVKTASTIPIVLGGQSKAKFSINGKHVWARKYVRKQPPHQHQHQQAAAQGATTSATAQPTSPAKPI